MTLRPTGGSPWPLRTVLLVGLWAGLGAAALELGVLFTRRVLLGQFVTAGRSVIWMAPLSTITVGLGVALVIGLVGLLIPRLRGPYGVVIPIGFGLALSGLQYLPRISFWAIELIALGVAIRRAALAARDQDRWLRMIRRSTLVLLGVEAALAVGTPIGWMLQERAAIRRLRSAPAGSPNVLLLVLDTVRAWQLSLYGYGRPTTPNLDRRAARGVVFERAYSESPWTLPAHGAMFTGHSPTELSTGWFAPLDQRYPTVAEVMRTAGYATGGFVANRRYANRASGLDRGFIHYADEAFSPIAIFASSRLIARWLRRLEIQNGDDYLVRKPADDVNREFFGWIDGQQMKNQRFFAFLNYFDAHTPYRAPSPWREQFATQRTEVELQSPNKLVQAYGASGFPDSILRQLVDRYDASIGYLDHQLELLLDGLESRGLLSNTVVLVTSDHGELLGEYRLLDHGNSLYPPLLQVPLVVLDPGSSGGIRVSQPISIRSLAASIAEIGAVAGAPLPGPSLVSWWRRGAEAGSRSAPSLERIPVSVDSDRRLWWRGTPINRGNLRGVIADSLLFISNGDGSEELYRVNTRGTAPNLIDDPRYQEVKLSLRATSRAPVRSGDR
jgi:arylsulfatase A-like enzyme